MRTGFDLVRDDELSLDGMVRIHNTKQLYDSGLNT